MSKVSDTWPHPLVKAEAEGCCGDDPNRGYLCQYHDGFAAGVETVLDLIEAISLGDIRPEEATRALRVLRG
jgi:hypothetical protein